MKADLRVYLVIGADFTGGRALVNLVLEAVAGGVTCVQLREKTADPRAFAAEAAALKTALAPTGVPLLINDNIAVARASGADGVHLGQSDLPCAEARRILGPGACIGLSIETRAQALAAAALDADYLGVSPVFPSASKTDTAAPWGLDGLRWLRERVEKPLVAIGGITIGNAGAVARAGAHGIAVISAIGSAPSPRAAAAALRRAVLGETGSGV
ncbi:MAG: thiamine phosphate synthase [Chthoniobacteraceae bacterium]|nr:thiamine phosphate synthase [Chthoniobacteraceae bacterium]